MNTEDKFYFGKPGEPESRKINDDLRRASVHISARNREGIEILETLWDAKNRGELSAGQESYLGELTKEARDIGWRPVVSKFSRPGQPERFGLEDACWEGYEPVGTKQKDGRTVPNCVPKDKNEQPEEFAAQIVSKQGAKRTEIKRDAAGKWAAVLIQSNPTGVSGERADEQVLDMKWYATEANARTAAQKMLSARPGEKEKFSNGDRNRRLMQVLADADRQIANKVVSNIAKNYGIGTLQVFAEIFDSEAEDLMDYVTEPVRSAAFAILQKKGMMSRPGQPDKFDASSLERGSFAEASKSPILGKLLSEKAMPEGGWRAVQAGSDTLVISFEDGDVAGNFARRVAGKGYSATSPVQAIGRYWNVEVKNGK